MKKKKHNEILMMGGKQTLYDINKITNNKLTPLAIENKSNLIYFFMDLIFVVVVKTNANKNNIFASVLTQFFSSTNSTLKKKTI